MLDLFADMPTVPDCTELLSFPSIKAKYRDAAGVAREMLREVKAWMKEHPGEDVTDIVPPTWKDYIIYNL